MLPRNQRLTTRRDFAAVYGRRRSVSGALLTLYTLSREGDGTGTRRFGFVVSKKVGKAHDRNAVKRRLRDICRLRQSAWRTGIDAILVARPAAAGAPRAALETETMQLFARAGLTQPETEP